MDSNIFQLNTKDFINGLVMAVIGGVALPLLAALQTPDFNIFTADWHSIGILALNGAVAAAGSYLLKKFVSTSDGKVFGRI
jgi:hypothetical protein